QSFPPPWTVAGWVGKQQPRGPPWLTHHSANAFAIVTNCAGPSSSERCSELRWDCAERLRSLLEQFAEFVMGGRLVAADGKRPNQLRHHLPSAAIVVLHEGGQFRASLFIRPISGNAQNQQFCRQTI